MFKFLKRKDNRLENEFEQYKALHKYSVLTARIMQYYCDMDSNNLIPEFIRREQYLARAKKDVKKILAEDKTGTKFNSLYEKAWEDIKDSMP